MTDGASRLEASLRRDIVAWSKLHGVPVAIHCNGLVGAELPDAVRDAVEHVVAEGLRNVAFHASAGRCSVFVRNDAGALRVLVEDDGVGFKVAGGYLDSGLGRLRERVTAAGAVLLLESGPGKGTTVGMEIRL
jgi:signal transduction histidine kinase